MILLFHHRINHIHYSWPEHLNKGIISILQVVRLISLDMEYTVHNLINGNLIHNFFKWIHYILLKFNYTLIEEMVMDIKFIFQA